MDKASIEVEALACTGVAIAGNEAERFANTAKIIQAFMDDGVHPHLHCLATSLHCCSLALHCDLCAISLARYPQSVSLLLTLYCLAHPYSMG